MLRLVMGRHSPDVSGQLDRDKRIHHMSHCGAVTMAVARYVAGMGIMICTC